MLLKESEAMDEFDEDANFASRRSSKDQVYIQRRFSQGVVAVPKSQERKMSLQYESVIEAH